MKKLVTLSTVIALHLAALGMLLMQPGCNSSTQPDPAKTATASAEGEKAIAQNDADVQEIKEDGSATAAAPAAPAMPEGSVALRATPTRPSATWNMDGKKGDVLVKDGAPAATVATPAPAASETPALTLSTYKVQKGDSLWSIAKKHNVKYSELLQANGLTKDSVLKIGQDISIPGGSLVSGKATSAAAPAVSAAPAAAAEPVSGELETYVVKSGDALSKIAKKHGVSVSQIRSINSLKSDNLKIGQKLQLPKGSSAHAASAPVAAPASTAAASAPAASSAAPAAAAGNGEIVYVVKSGETLGVIAKRNGTTVSAIAERNGIKDPRKLKVGQKLVIKSSSKTAVASAPAVEPAAAPAAGATTPAAPAADAAPAISVQQDAPASPAPAGGVNDAEVIEIN